jgi:hypothetical protein
LIVVCVSPSGSFGWCSAVPVGVLEWGGVKCKQLTLFRPLKIKGFEGVADGGGYVGSRRIADALNRVLGSQMTGATLVAWHGGKGG